MKSFKLLTLLVAITLAGCNTTNINSSISSNDSSSTNDALVSSSNSVTESASSDESSSTSSGVSSSSSSSSSESSSASSSSTTTDGQRTITVNLYNPSCGSFSKEVLNDRLSTYINEIAGFTFVTSLVGENCQVSNDIPTKGNSVLIIGAASTTGSLDFTFSETVKSLNVTAQTYHKPYIETWNGNKEVPNVDPNSVCGITTVATAPTMFIDLAPVDGQPAEKQVEIKDLNSKKLKLYSTTDEKGRVFIKNITFVL